ncbi:MAG: hypothetical protein AAF601_06630 [Pseudomonadota bacterium]
MSAHRQIRGAAPVGYLHELDPTEEGAVLCFRRWNAGHRAQAEIWDQFATALGPSAVESALDSLNTVCDLCARHGRRPLVRHAVNCPCLGGDESCFATFIGYACEGAREDALLIATTMVRPDIAPMLVAHAAQFGLALRRVVADNAFQTKKVNYSPTKPMTVH